MDLVSVFASCEVPLSMTCIVRLFSIQVRSETHTENISKHRLDSAGVAACRTCAWQRDDCHDDALHCMYSTNLPWGKRKPSE